MKNETHPPSYAPVAPTWLRLSCFIVGCVVPAIVVASGIVYLLWTSVELSLPVALVGLTVAALAFATALVGVLAVGFGILVYQDIDATRFTALLTGVGALLLAIGVAYDFSITKNWTANDLLIATVVTYYLLTASALHGRLAYLLARQVREEEA